LPIGKANAAMLRGGQTQSKAWQKKGVKKYIRIIGVREKHAPHSATQGHEAFQGEKVECKKPGINNCRKP